MLNTLKTNLILTRAVLIALFAGLFILAACGGGGGAAAPVATGDPVVNPCDTNPYGEGCNREVDATARTRVYNACRDLTTTRTDADACENVPVGVISCLDDPFLTTCNQTDLEASGATSGAFLSLQNTRINVCRDGNTIDDGRCTNALATRCFADGANPNIFDTLCSKSSAERDTIIAKCAINATELATDADCAPALAAAGAGFACFQNPWDADCELLPDFANHLAVARTNRATYCADTTVDNFNSDLCTTATAQVCADSGTNANPFSALCTDPGNTYDSVRTAFATNCFNDANNGADCDVTFELPRTGSVAECDGDGTTAATMPNSDSCKTRPTPVATCASAPFSADCREVATFTGARAGLLGVCTNGVNDGQASEFYCGQAGGFSNEETDCIENPFRTVSTTGAEINCGTLFTALGDDTSLKTAQDALIEVCTSADGAGNLNCMSARAGMAVADCLANPFETACDTALGATQAGVARTNILTLCTTADSDNFRMNTLCTGLSGNVKTCLDNPFTAEDMTPGSEINCITSLGDTQAVMRAQANLNALCLGDSLTRNALCTPELKTSQFCSATADGANPFNVNCDAVDGIDAGARTTFCNANTGDDNCTTDLNTLRTTCSANPFADACLVADSGYEDNRKRAVAACNRASDKATDTACTDVEVKAEVVGPSAAPAVTLASCFAEPFQSACADGVFDVVKADARFVCGANQGQASIDACAIVVGQDSDDMDVTVAMCNADPLNSACADKSFDVPRLTRVDLCLNAGDRTTVAECDIEIKAMVAAEGNNPMIPAVTVEDCIDDPFNADCTDGAFDNARGASYNTCANAVATDSATATTNADCIRDVVAGVPAVTGPNPVDEIPAVTVADCVADPFSTGCVIDGFKDARNGICQSSSDARSFNAGCTVEDYLNIADTREDAIEFCRLNSDGVGCDTAVSSETDAPTVAACATNPFTAGCDAELFDTAERQVTYCAEGASTIFDTNCDTRDEVSADRDAAVRTCLADSGETVCTNTILVKGRAEVKAVAIGDVTDFGDDGVLGGGDDTVATEVVVGVTGIDEVTLASCVADPYLSECTSISLFDNARFAHTEVCMRDGRADDAECMTLLGILSAETATTAQKARAVCITDPFASTCSGNAYSSAKTNRYAFCRDTAVIADAGTDGLCAGDGEVAGTSIVSDICSWNGTDSTTEGTGTRINPIAGICPDTNTLDRARYCGVGDRSVSEDACGATAVVNVNTADGCLANPFSAECTTNTGNTITTELRTFLRDQRTDYCTNRVGDDDFQAAVCQTTATDDVDFASRVCAADGAEANPFADFCVREGRAENEFDDVRATFVGNCKAFAENAVTGAFDGSGACTTEINTCIGAPFVAGTGATDCINENAYASERQAVVDRCVIAFGLGNQATDSDCMTITDVGQLTCITENPYENRAEVKTGDIVTTVGLNCLGNSNYDMVRETLEDTTCNAAGVAVVGTDARCGTVLAGVCGTGTAGSELAIGTDPFNAKFCLDAANIADYVDQRETLVANCVANPDAAGCTTQIAACIANPFLVDGIATGVNCDDDRFKAAFVNPTLTYCGTGMTGGTANISLDECRAFGQSVANANACINNPFDSGCVPINLGGADDAVTNARLLRATYCLTQGTSDAIRQDVALQRICRGAVSDVCKGDALFDGAGTYNCLADSHATYNTARETHYDLCDGDAASRTDVTCTLAMAEICTNETGLQTNPFAPICTEGNSDQDATTAKQLAVIANCAVLDSNTQAQPENIRCTRGDAAAILSTCSADARDSDCDDYAATGQIYEGTRRGQYVANCADADAIAGGPDAALCPEANVKPLICVDSGTNARPFAPICGEGTVIDNLATRQNTLLAFCLAAGNGVMAQCAAGTSPLTAGVLDTCGSDATDNPFATDASVTGITGTVNCNAFAAFETARTTYQTTCEAGTDSAYTKSLCSAAISGIVTTVCGGGTTLNAKSNPFNPILCTGTDIDNIAKQTLAAACVGQAAGFVVTGNNNAVCIQSTRDCANRPFFGTDCTDAGYNAQKTIVLDACNTAAKIIANDDGRCNTAVTDVACLKDPFNCTGTPADFSEATVDEAQYLIDLTADRLTYCGTGANINAQKSVCRTASDPHSFCLANPFGTGCNPHLGANNGADFREDRITFCFGDGDAAANAAAKAVVTNRIGTARRAQPTPTAGDVALCATPLTGAVTQYLDAIGFICYGSAVGTTQTEAAATGDKTRDPFSDFCRADADYNARRAERILECAGAAISNTVTTTSDALEPSAVFSCNWAAQVTHCANTDAALNAQCGEINTAPKWVSATTTIAFTNSTGTANAFIDDLDNVGTAPTFTEANLVLNTDLPGRRIEDTDLPNVRFYSARTDAVRYTCEDDHVQPDSPAPQVTCTTEINGIRLGGSSFETVGNIKTSAGTARFFAGIEVNSGNVGRPVFNRNDTAAVWTGTIDWIGVGTANNSNSQARNFNMLVNFADRTIQGAISVNHNPPNAGRDEHIAINGSYDAAGYISGDTYIRNYLSTGTYDFSNPIINTAGTAIVNTPGVVSGLIGHLGAVGVFISNGPTNGYGGGFIVKPQ